MPKTTDIFGPIFQSVTLDANGNGTVSFQAVGHAIRISNIFFAVATSTNQAVCTIYKGTVANGRQIFNSNSGSTGGNAKGNVDCVDGETVFVRWTGGDVGAVATATFTGVNIPFQDIRASNLTFDDPIAAGDGSLIFPALKSPNYVANTTGWKIDRLGNAEFNNATVRGQLIAGGGNVLVNASGFSLTGPNAVYEINIASGFIAHLVPDDGSYTHVQTAFIFFNPPDPSPINALPVDAGFIGSSYVGSEIPRFAVSSPNFTGKTSADIFLFGQSSGSSTDDSQILLQASELRWNDYNVDAGKGWVNSVGTNVASGAIGNTETTVLTFGSRTYKANRAYALMVTGTGQVSAANSRPSFRLRKTNPAGQQLCGASYPGLIAATTNYYIGWNDVFCVGASDVTAALAVTAQGSGAFNVTIASANNYSANIQDMGDAAKISGFATALV